MDAPVLSTEGAELRTISLADDVFAREVREGAIYHAIRNELANARVGTACTKGRSEVNGTGKKPWRQKGTGRARAGSRRSPVWVGGGTVFGPKPRSYRYRLPRKIKRLAMKSILSLHAHRGSLKVVEDFALESGKTKDLVRILHRLGGTARPVIVLPGDDRTTVRRSGHNIPGLTFLNYNQLRAHDLFYGKTVFVMESAVRNLNVFYGEGEA
jgi:large subunit ribosomal protein L4